MNTQQEKAYQELKAQLDLDNMIETVWSQLFETEPTNLRPEIVPSRAVQIKLNIGWLLLPHSLETLGLIKLPKQSVLRDVRQ